MGKFISTVILQWQGGIIPILHSQHWGPIRLGLYGPFNVGVHFAMLLAQLQSLVKSVQNVLYMVSLAANTALCAHFCCQLQQKFQSWPPTSKKNMLCDHLSEAWLEWDFEVQS